MTIDDDAFTQKGSELIRLTAAKLEPALVEFTRNRIKLMLTPESVTKTSAPPFTAPRAVIPFDIDQGVKSLYSHRITIYGKTTTMHVYEGGIKFPAQRGERQRIVEVVDHQISWGKADLVRRPGERNTTYEERRKRYKEAYGYNRYWFAIPTSSHIHIEKRKITFADREYARRFAEFNHLEGGVWKSEKQRTNAIIGIIVGVVGSIAPFVFIESLFQRFDWLGLIILMAITTIAVTASVLIASRGEESL